MANRNEKLAELLDIEGFDNDMDFMDEYGFDSVVPGICMNDQCDYTTQVEPDSTDGWCEFCDDNSVESGTSLAGF